MTDLTITNVPELKGRHGWLAFLGVALILSAIRSVAQVFQQYSANWADLQTVSAKFPMMMQGVFVFDTILPLGLLALTIGCYFASSRFFQLAYTATVIALAVDLPLCALWTSWTSPLSFSAALNFYTADDWGRTIGGIIGALPWLIYIYKSKRVRNTFVN
jgi:hypothetical protein